MGIGVSIFLLALGAILTFAVEATVEGLDIATVGVILMIVGAIGLLFSLLFWSSWAGRTREERTIVRDDRVL
jgi:hypothetical protein